jgi:hypothetical protein
MGVPTQEASRVGIGSYKYAGANGFATSTLLELLNLAGAALADLPGATNNIVTDPSILTGYDIYIVTGGAAIYFKNNGGACTANDYPLDAGASIRERDTAMQELKKRRFFSPPGTAFDIRIALWG